MANHVTHSNYLDLLQKAGNQLKILPHKVIIKRDCLKRSELILANHATDNKYLDPKAGNQRKILHYLVINKGLSREIIIDGGKTVSRTVSNYLCLFRKLPFSFRFYYLPVKIIPHEIGISKLGTVPIW